MFGVYKVNRDGTETYLGRSATQSEKLAREIAEERTRGEITLPDGSIKTVKPAKHIHREI